MEKKSYGELLGTWFKWRFKTIGLILLLMGDYILIGSLMHLELSGVFYSSFLGLFIGSIIALLDFRKYIQKYKALYCTFQNKQHSLSFLPEPENLIEESYTKVIQHLYEELTDLKSKVKRQNEEANDYYTLWMHQIKTPIAAMRLIIQNQRKLEFGRLQQAGSEEVKDNEWDEEKEEVLVQDQQTSRESAKGKKGYSQDKVLSQLEGEVFKVEQYAEMALQYLRLESMSQDLVLRKYKLYDIVANALKKFAFMFIGKKLSISIEPFETEVITDEKWLQFVIEQILSNSMKYTVSGGITIEMADKETLKISDTGIGIQSEDLPRIFERGFTGYNGRMDKKSTGIGLYLCKKVTCKLAHTLEVESKIGVGTSFYIGFQTSEAVRTLQE